MTTPSLMEMSDDDLAALMVDDSAEEPAEQAEPTGEVSETPAAQESAEPAAQTETPAPAARQVPLAEVQRERQKRQQAEAILSDPNALAQRLAQMGYQVAQPQQEQQPEFLDEALAQYTQQQMQGMQGQVSQQMQQMRSQLSVELARVTIPDWQQTIDAFLLLADDPEMGPVLAALDQSVMQSPNPAVALYNHAKRFTAPKATLTEADVERRVAEGVAAALAKQQPGIQGPKGVARAGSVTPGLEKPKSLQQMTDDELDKQLYSED